jgi:hypothetical protein
MSDRDFVLGALSVINLATLSSLLGVFVYYRWSKRP